MARIVPGSLGKVHLAVEGTEARTCDATDFPLIPFFFVPPISKRIRGGEQDHRKKE
jgi:hypothetical protein